jgi:hypothetical protein
MFKFRFKAFNYKEINALLNIVLLKCIIMNFIVFVLLLNLISYIFLHIYSVNFNYLYSDV